MKDEAETRARVLLVEDDRDTAQLVERHLRALGFTVDCAANGEQAILVSQNHLPAVVVMDAMMPLLDGFETTRYLKVRYPGYLPVLMLTALDDAEAVARAEAAGADYFLTKPVRRAPLSEALLLLDRLRRAEDALEVDAVGAEAEAVEARLAVAGGCATRAWGVSPRRTSPACGRSRPRTRG